MFVDEYQELHDLIVCGDYSRALALIGELDAMCRRDYVRKIRNYMRVILIQLIRRHAERRDLKSRRRSIVHALAEIELLNERGGPALDPALDPRDFPGLLEEAWGRASAIAAIEIDRRLCPEHEIARRVDREAILAEALALIAGDEAPGD